ncbi:MAG: Na+/H+ antiporter NhaD/arsenite permease-like protein, partial [Myxococcota bacterium]
FFSFFFVSAPFVVVASILTLAVGANQFNIHGLRIDTERAEAQALVDEFDENDGIERPGFFKFAVVMTGLFVITIAATSVLPVIAPLGMGFVALSFAGVMLLWFRSEVDVFYRTLDWDLLGFFVALFVVINVMEHAGVLGLIGNGLTMLLSLGDTVGTGALLVASAGFSSVTDNIPLAAMLARILDDMAVPSDSALWWSVVFGANLGGNLTPIGSASTLVAVTIIHKHGINLSFAGFVKLAAPYAILQIILAVGYVLLFLV